MRYEFPCLIEFRDNNRGMIMSMISITEMPAAIDTRAADYNFKTILILSCIGLVASFGMMAAGVDLSVAFA